jgi:hypothetical protein
LPLFRQNRPTIASSKATTSTIARALLDHILPTGHHKHTPLSSLTNKENQSSQCPMQRNKVVPSQVQPITKAMWNGRVQSGMSMEVSLFDVFVIMAVCMGRWTNGPIITNECILFA